MMKYVQVAGGLATAMLSVTLAHAAVGDISYDPNPALVDVDKSAQFDAYSVLTSAVLAGHSLTPATQDFEHEYSSGQSLEGWQAIGSTHMRFAMGSPPFSLQSTTWIQPVDSNSSQFGLAHPQGTYGNVAGVLNDPRNYVADHYFLTGSTQTGADANNIFVVEFQSPVSFLGFTLLNYTSQAGGSAQLTLWSGDSLATASQVQTAGSGVIAADIAPGGLRYVVGNGPADYTLGHALPSFNFAVLNIGAPDAQIGFDNFTVGIAQVPELETYALLLAGLGCLATRVRRQRG